jgi:hypothetical protein
MKINNVKGLSGESQVVFCEPGVGWQRLLLTSNGSNLSVWSSLPG